MKKIKLKKPAFSLAEALITLLIVCLVTLASIPVLTKKKRNPNEYASGQWMCTKNSSGQYVYYTSSDPQGDVQRPDTWKTLPNATSCTFVPPQNAKNFGVTVIGGGGGGRDGVSEQKDYIDSRNLSTTIGYNKGGTYNVAVIGGGGGGHGSDDSGDGCNGVGGQGGAGGAFLGTVNFSGGETLVAQIGAGGRGCYDGGSKGGWCNQGGESSLYISGTKFITADGGYGGRATSDGHRPKHGDGGDGGKVTVNSSFQNKIVSSAVVTGIGGAKIRHCGLFIDEGNACPTHDSTIVEGPKEGWVAQHKIINNKNCYGIHNGTLLGELYNNLDGTEYGRGGFGCQFKNSTGGDGTTGVVRVWQIEMRAGNGGKAAKLSTFSIPSIKNKMVVTIGEGGAANSNGATTIARIYNSAGNVIRELRGDGGIAGTQGNIEINPPARGTRGENSYWLPIGGGSVGSCRTSWQQKTEETIEEEQYVYDDDGNRICDIAVYFLGAVYKNAPPLDTVCPLNDTSTPKGFCVGCPTFLMPNGSLSEVCRFDSYGIPLHEPTAIDYFRKINSYESYEPPLLSLQDYKSYFGNKYMIQRWSNSSSSNLVGYKYEVGSPTCLSFKTQKVQVTKPSYTTVPAGCDNSGNGTYFGAGGGGGGTTNYIGEGGTGKGGNGAPGAVIVEW